MHQQRKKTILRYAEKLEIIQYKRSNPQYSYAEIAEIFEEKFKTKISFRLVSDVCRKLKNISHKSLKKETKKIRQPVFIEIEKCLIIWTEQQNIKGIPITDDLLRERAKMFAASLKLTSFKASNGWIDRFKKRNNLKSFNLHGDMASYNMETIEIERKKIAERLEFYDLSDIYNMDETGLIFKALPSRSITTHQRAGRK